jgi:hypothetical protein
MKPHTGFLSVGQLYIFIDMVSLPGNSPDSSTNRLVMPQERNIPCVFCP